MTIKFDPIANTLEVYIKLSLQRALLSEISSNVRSVQVDWSEGTNTIEIFFYFDGEISEEDKESACNVAGEVGGDFDEETRVLEKCIRKDFSLDLPKHRCTVFRRKEL